MCEGLSEEGTEENPRGRSSPCSVSPLFPQPFYFAAAKLKLKVLKTSYFYCAVSQGASCCELNDMLLSFGEKKEILV